MSVQHILDAASAANATTMGTGHASRIFNESLKNSINVRIQLKADDRSYLTRTSTVSFYYTNEKPVTSDHALLAAMREVSRDVYERLHSIANTNVRSLVIGAAAREIRLYNQNPFIHYFVHGKENKDYDRIIRPALSDIAQMLKKKAGKDDRKVFLPQDPSSVLAPRPANRRYESMLAILKDYTELGKMPASIHLDLIESEVLLFEDSIYNFGRRELCDIFRETKANIAYGYALLPNELIFDELPDNRIYRFHRYTEQPLLKNNLSDVYGREVAALTFRKGYSNGYIHDYEKWKTLMAYPTFSHCGVNLAVEIEARIGCMAIFKIYRCAYPEKIIRTIELPDNESAIKLLDLWASVDHRSCKLRRPLIYFSVREYEFFETFNYLMSLDPKSLTLQNCIMFVRRRMGGMALVARELTSPWDLQRNDVYRFAVAIYVQAKIMDHKTTKSLLEMNPYSVWEKFKRLAVTTIRTCFYPIALLVDLVLQENLTDRVVLWPKHGNSILQRSSCYPAYVAYDRLGASLYTDFPNEDEVLGCPFCDDMNSLDFEEQPKKRGQQFNCGYHDESNHTFKLSDNEVAFVFVKLADDDTDPVGLKAVKAAAKEKFPKTGFSHTCRVTYIRGGPGTGKSYIIRALADQNDLILAPFTKLKTDYMNVKTADGKMDLCFKTQHRGMAETGHKRLFVDEFSSYPYEFLAAQAYLNQCDEVVLVGDDRQCRVKEPEEGFYIGNRIDLPALSQHELLVNFRNPVDAINILNTVYGYSMIPNPKQTRQQSIRVVPYNYSLPETGLRMAFTKLSASNDAQNEKATVRSNQGGTTAISILYITADNGNLPQVPELGIVAISRHTEVLYLVSDDSPTSKAFLSTLGISEDWISSVETFVDMPQTNIARRTLGAEPKITPVVAIEHAPKDVHLIGSTLVPAPSTQIEEASYNEMTSQVLPDAFAKGKTNLVDLFSATNARGHPVSYEDTFYSISPGHALNYSSKLPLQEMAVMAARYDVRTPRKPFDESARKFVESLVDRYFEDCKNPLRLDEFLTEEYVSQVANQFMKDAVKKGYPSKFNGEKGFGLHTVQFHVKSILKPISDFKGINLYKAGQGISVWSAESVSMFCLAFRLLKELDKCSDRSDRNVRVLNDDGMSDINFIEHSQETITEIFGKGESQLPFLHGILDAVEFDAGQNEATQYLEMYYWLKLGVSSEFLSFYYTFRRDYTMNAKLMSAVIAWAKNSGEPATLLNNGVITKVIGHSMIWGEGPLVLMSKGDDFDKMQMNMKIDKDTERQVSLYTSMKLRVSISDTGEFCGYAVGPDGFIPNLHRRVVKIMGCRWKSYDHFTEYQKSLRDYVKICTRVGVDKCIAGTMATEKCTYQEAEYCFYFIDSVSHINFAQFFNMVERRTVNSSIPVLDDTTPKGVAFRV